jgi:exodeoxyribonuclease V alpha subunit
MTVAALHADFFDRLFSGLGAELSELYAKAAENGALTHTDFYTIRDLLELGGLEHEEPLHALLLALLLALEEGSLCVELSEAALSQRLADLVEEPTARMWAERILRDFDQRRYGDLIGSSLDSSKPVVLVEKDERKYVYFQKYLKSEQVLCEELRKRLARPPTALCEQRAEILSEVLDRQPLHLGGRPMHLNRAQKAAVDLALRRNFAIVSGGPGTGKTSIVFTLLRCLLRAGIAVERIALAAPTGRAAQRLTDALRISLNNLPGPPEADRPLATVAATTLHQLLRYLPDRGIFLQHAENPLSADVVIVDEVSMIGVSLMAQLFQALAPETRVVLLGDKDQLSSVEAGAVLANLVRGRAGDVSPPVQHPLEDAIVVLEENYRSQQEIQRIAAAVNQQQAGIVEELRRLVPGEASLADVERQGGCWLLETAAGRLGAWREVLEQWAQHHYGDSAFAELARSTVIPGGDIPPAERDRLDRLFAVLGQARILTLLREGPWGCEGINEFLEQRLRPRLDRGSRGGLFAGAPVLITRNDRARQLFNGDVGLALKSQGGGYRVLFQRLGGHVAIPADNLPPHELAFAMTVHKSQGSEYERVLLVLPPEGGRRLLTKEMIYTGITRAKELAVIAATPEVLKFAISRRIERQSALLTSLGI